MGYTRYWKRTSKPYDEDFLNQVKKLVADGEKKGITLCAADGEGKPVLRMDAICINGCEAKGTDHEPLCIYNPDSQYYEARSAFCKTARKPYDYVVREVLKLAEEQGIITNLDSDGANEEIISDSEFLIGSLVSWVKWDVMKYPEDKERNSLIEEMEAVDVGDSIKDYLKEIKRIASQDSLLFMLLTDKIKKYGMEG